MIKLPRYECNFLVNTYQLQKNGDTVGAMCTSPWPNRSDSSLYVIFCQERMSVGKQQKRIMGYWVSEGEKTLWYPCNKSASPISLQEPFDLNSIMHNI